MHSVVQVCCVRSGHSDERCFAPAQGLLQVCVAKSPEGIDGFAVFWDVVTSLSFAKSAFTCLASPQQAWTVTLLQAGTQL